MGEWYGMLLYLIKVVIKINKSQKIKDLNIKTWNYIRRKPKTVFLFVCLFVCFGLLRATHMAYRSSQGKGWIGAVAAGLCHSHSNAGSYLSVIYSSWQCRMLNPLREARGRTRILMDATWVHYYWATVGIPGNPINSVCFATPCL